MAQKNLIKTLVDHLRPLNLTSNEQVFLCGALLLAQNDKISTRANLKSYLNKWAKQHNYQLPPLLQSIVAKVTSDEIIVMLKVITDQIKFEQNPNALVELWQAIHKWNNGGVNAKGQVFSPLHIAKLMAELINIQSYDVTIDPASGFGALLMQLDGPVVGYEINDEIAQLCNLNMALIGKFDCKINRDSFFNIKARHHYTKIIANPPFSQKNDPELKFAFTALDHAAQGAQMAIILPKSTLKATNKIVDYNANNNAAYLAKIWSFCRFDGAISLPNELFLPNAGVATVIAFFTKLKDYDSTVQDTTTIYKQARFISLQDDGFIKTKNNVRYDGGAWVDKLAQIKQLWINKKEMPGICTIQDAQFNTTLLYENFYSPNAERPNQKDFIALVRDHLAAKVRLGQFPNWDDTLELGQKFALYQSEPQFAKFKLVDVINKVATGNQKRSIDKKLDNKYQGTIPLIIAKKDNNGIGGTIDTPVSTWVDKLVIINGGDGGGGKTYYCDFEFAATGFATICEINPKLNLDYYAKLYLATVITKVLYKYIGHGFNFKTINPNLTIELPVDKDGQIDATLMSDYIRALPIFET